MERDEPHAKAQEYQQHVTIDTIPEDGQRILKDYSGLDADEILPHVLAIRDKGFQIAQFACIGQIKFLNNRLPKLPYYSRFVHGLQQGGRLMDVGCGLGQELRYLAVDEAIDPSQLYGFDLEQGLIDLGFELFRDKGIFQADMFAADLMGSPLEQPARLKQIQGTMDLVQVSQVLHVFDWDDMLEAAKRLVALGKAAPGTLIAGTQMGSRNAGSYPMPRRNTGTGKNYRHNAESMSKFWKVVGDETGSAWSVECAEIYSKAVEQNKNAWWAKADPGGCMIYFCATRL